MKLLLVMSHLTFSIIGKAIMSPVRRAFARPVFLSNKLTLVW